MDLNDFWQENKRFVIAVGCGLLLFFVGQRLIASNFGSARRDVERSLAANNRQLRDVGFDSADLAVAEEENERLRAAVGRLEEAVAFRPRPSFQLQPDAGSADNQYVLRVSQVTQELERLAGRSAMALPDGLGLETVDSVREERIVRHLEALDLIDRLLRLAVELGVDRVADIGVRLDPAFDARGKVEAIERTRVELELVSRPGAVAAFLVATQSERTGQPIPIDKLEVVRARAKEDEVRAQMTFLVVRLHERAGAPAEQELEN